MEDCPPRASLVAASLVGLLAVAGGARLAAAQSDGEPIRLEYRASATCPDEGAFRDRVRARTSRARFVGKDELARTFVVELTAGARPSGSVRVTEGGRGEGRRHLEAETCDGVADALSLIVALALDPHALTAARVEAAPSQVTVEAIDAGPSFDAAQIPDAGASAPDAASPPSSSSSSPEPPDAAPLPPAIEDDAASASEPPSPDDPREVPAPARDRHFFAGADFVVATGVTPVTTFAGAPYVGWRSTRPVFLGIALGLRAAFLRAGTGTLDVPGGTADFTWTVGRLDGCAMLWPGRALRVGACGRVEGGVLDASGQAATGAETQHSAWVALGTMGHVEWSLLGPLMLDVGAGPSFPLSVERFYFNPAATGPTAHQVSAVGFAGEAGLGVHFL